MIDTDEFEILQMLIRKHFAEKISEEASCNLYRVLESTTLVGGENEIIKKAIPKRAHEFSAGRMCARKCLYSFGIENFEILQGKFGEPLWPNGITGSITHHSGMAIAVSMPLKHGYLGIDIVDLSENLPEPAAVLSEIELEGAIFKNVENTELLLFSMKESVIKILSPLLQEYVEFRDIEIKFDDDAAKVKFRAENINIDLFWLCHGQYAFTMAFMKT